MEIWKDSSILYDGRVVKLRVGQVTLDDDSLAHREVIEHPGGVCILPFTGTHVILVRQFRIALDQYVLEAPAGKLEGNEDPLARGIAELEEETGYIAGSIIPAGSIFASVGFCSEVIHLYLALDLTKTAQRLEREERIELVEMTLNEVRAALRDYTLRDAKTVALLHRLLAHLDREGGA
jgi:ADP-ribose pyrophosphatase